MRLCKRERPEHEEADQWRKENRKMRLINEEDRVTKQNKYGFQAQDQLLQA